jgi:hypothetical protein
MLLITGGSRAVQARTPLTFWSDLKNTSTRVAPFPTAPLRARHLGVEDAIAATGRGATTLACLLPLFGQHTAALRISGRVAGTGLQVVPVLPQDRSSHRGRWPGAPGARRPLCRHSRRRCGQRTTNAPLLQVWMGRSVPINASDCWAVLLVTALSLDCKGPNSSNIITCRRLSSVPLRSAARGHGCRSTAFTRVTIRRLVRARSYVGRPA